MIDVDRLVEAVRANIDALGRIGKPGFPPYEAGIRIVAADLELALERCGANDEWMDDWEDDGRRPEEDVRVSGDVL